MEYTKLIAQSSSTNSIHDVGPYTVVGAVDTPSDANTPTTSLDKRDGGGSGSFATFTGEFDYRATSFGSRTMCAMVTKQCGPQYVDPGGSDAAEDVTYKCDPSTAGLNLAGNFSVFTTSSDGSGNLVEDSDDGDGMMMSGFQFGTQYYHDSTMRNKSSGPPAPYNENILYWALVFVLEESGTDANGHLSVYAHPDDINDAGLVGLKGGLTGGILSCNTSLSEVVSK